LVQGVYLAVLAFDLIDNYLYFWVLRLVLWILQDGRDALPMEGVKTREDIEFSVKYGCITDVAALARIYCDVFVSLAALLISKLFCVVSIFLNLASQARYLLFIVFETVA